jgi:uncharacterized membrane protein
VISLSDESRIDEIQPALFEKVFAADLHIAVVWLAASILSVYLPGLNETPIKTVLIVPGLLFLPGYCLIAALFPGYSDIDLHERIALSIGLSVAVVPLIAFGLNFTPFGIRLDPVLITVTIFTLVMILVAYYRRALLRSQERLFHSFFSFKWWTGFFPDFLIRPDPDGEKKAIRHIEEIIRPDESGGIFLGMADTFRNAVFSQEDRRVDRLLSVVFIGAFIIAVLVTIYAISVPKEGERFTEFFILGEKQKAAGYPDLVSVGQNYPLYIGVGNHEYRNTNYTIETWLIRTEFDNVTNTSHLTAMYPNNQLSFGLAHNETRIIPYNLTVRNPQYNQVEFLLFRDNLDNPYLTGSDRINASYRELHLGITAR